MQLPAPKTLAIQSTGDVVARLLWLAMVVIHVGPLMRVGTFLLAGELHGARWISLIALVLSIGFFCLKLLGVSFLRLRGRWTPVVLFLVACGLLHGNATPHQWLEKTGYTVLIASAAAGTSELTSRRMRRRLADAFNELSSRLRSLLAAKIDDLRRVSERAETEAAALGARLVALMASAPRGPPVPVILRAC